MLEMSTAYLPVSDNWHKFINKAETVYKEAQQSIAEQLQTAAIELARQLAALDDDHGTIAYERDPWMWAEEWTGLCKKGKDGKTVYWSGQQITDGPRYGVLQQQS